jgi:hypothetical protein
MKRFALIGTLFALFLGTLAPVEMALADQHKDNFKRECKSGGGSRSGC